MPYPPHFPSGRPAFPERQKGDRVGIKNITPTSSKIGISLRRMHLGMSLLVVTLLVHMTTVSAHGSRQQCPMWYISSARNSPSFNCPVWISGILSPTATFTSTGVVEPSLGTIVTSADVNTTNTGNSYPTETIRSKKTLPDKTTIDGTNSIIDTIMMAPGTIWATGPSTSIPRPAPTLSMPAPTLADGPIQTPILVKTKNVEVKCYNLPYGFFGFIGHTVFLYSTAMIGLGRKPSAPFDEPIKGPYLYNAAIAFAHSAGIGCLVATNIAKCEMGWSPSWQLGLVSLWQLLESGVYVAVLLDRLRTRRDEVARSQLHEAFVWTRSKKPFLWFTLTHALVAIPGFVALVFLIRRVWGKHNLPLIIITSVFYTFFGLGIFLGCMIKAGRIFNVYPHVPVEDPMERCWDVFFSACLLLLMVFAVVGLVYSDVALHIVLHTEKRNYKSVIAYGMAFVCWLLPLFHY